MISEEDKIRVSEKLSNEFDFFRRIDGRLSVQQNRLKQLKDSLVNVIDKKKIHLINERISEINICISEMEFIKNNIIDDFMREDIEMKLKDVFKDIENQEEKKYNRFLELCKKSIKLEDIKPGLVCYGGYNFDEKITITSLPYICKHSN